VTGFAIFVRVNHALANEVAWRSPAFSLLSAANAPAGLIRAGDRHRGEPWINIDSDVTFHSVAMNSGVSRPDALQGLDRPKGPKSLDVLHPLPGILGIGFPRQRSLRRMSAGAGNV